MNNINSRSVIENYNQVKELYDQEFFDSSSLLSLVKFLIYFPLGLVILLVRLVLVCFLNLFVKLVPSLQNNRIFIRLTAYSFGLTVRLTNKTNAKNLNNNSNLVFIANHVSCFDYLAIKLIINEANYTEEHSLQRNLTSESSSKLFDLIAKFFFQILHSNAKKNSKLTVCFPEQTSTNGTYGLLKFDSKIFDQDQTASYVPVCIRVKRSLIPFRTNYIYSNDFENCLVSMYSPLTVYELTFLPNETRLDNESSEQLSERIRTKIASSLKVKLVDYNNENLKQIYTDYVKYLREQARQVNQQQQQVRQQSQRIPNRQRTDTISFNDMSRVALQVKDILPDVAFETIKNHVNSTASLDVDTIIASILDANEALSTDTSSATSSNNSNSNTNQSQQATSSKKINAYMSYEEKKFTLLNEARKRYLAKHKN